jgi:hypothetical protein
MSGSGSGSQSRPQSLAIGAALLMVLSALGAFALPLLGWPGWIAALAAAAALIPLSLLFCEPGAACRRHPAA